MDVVFKNAKNESEDEYLESMWVMWVITQKEVIVMLSADIKSNETPPKMEHLNNTETKSKTVRTRERSGSPRLLPRAPL